MRCNCVPFPLIRVSATEEVVIPLRSGIQRSDRVHGPCGPAFRVSRACIVGNRRESFETAKSQMIAGRMFDLKWITGVVRSSGLRRHDEFAVVYRWYRFAIANIGYVSRTYDTQCSQRKYDERFVVACRTTPRHVLFGIERFVLTYSASNQVVEFRVQSSSRVSSPIFWPWATIIRRMQNRFAIDCCDVMRQSVQSIDLTANRRGK